MTQTDDKHDTNNRDDCDTINDAKTGRFVKGHRKRGGRKPNVVNRITRSLREQVLDGFADVTQFVQQLKIEHPPAAAGLLARILPPGETEPGKGGTVTTINIFSVPSGWRVSEADAERIKNGQDPIGPLLEARAWSSGRTTAGDRA